ncbi:MAG: Ig-like domain-containing protein [Bifidobacterium sp.]|nr:Ig-like domain-containing protein [Bifidobacterium sp.]
MRALVRGRKRAWLMPVLALLAVLAVVVGAVIVSSVMQRHLQLDDGTVWVTSQADGKAARYNVKLREADASVAASSPTFDVAQQGSSTVLTEENTASAIDAATISTTDSTKVGSHTETYLGGGTVAFLDTSKGDVWLADADKVKDTDPTTGSPDLSLGEGGKVAVADDGTVYGYRPKDGRVLKVTGRNASSAETIDLTDGGKGRDADSFTVVDGTPVISDGDELVWPRGQATFKDAGPLTLQAAAEDGGQSGWVAAASEQGLATVDLPDGKARLIASGSQGDPAQPVSVGGCVYAAFAQPTSNFIRRCSPDATGAGYSSLEGISRTSQLKLRTNHRLVVLNDVANGNVWNPEESPDVIKLQWKKLEDEQQTAERTKDDSTSNQHDFERACSSRSGQIKAVDDEFGARAGSQEVLDVLRNDEQTDCSVLRITSVSAPKNGTIRVTPIQDGRYLQLDATGATAGTVTFDYEISDGRGQSASATVTVDVVASGDRAPRQDGKPEEIAVEEGSTYVWNAMGSFSDPDGDPLTLVRAVVENTDEATVSTRADGQLTFHAGAMSKQRATVRVTVSDGRQTCEGTVYFSVRPANTLAAQIDPVVRRTTPDTPIRVSLTDAVHGTSAQAATLTAVQSPDKASAKMQASDMAFTFTAQQPGTYYVPYTVTQGTVAATGLARIEVEALAKEDSKPVAVNDTAVLGADGTAIVEPLANDIDPTGGVLSVTGVKAPDDGSVKVGVVSNRRVYLTAVREPSEPVTLTYTVANAAGESTGTIVMQPATAREAGVPSASDVTVTVRTGGIVSVDVPDHVSTSDGSAVTLDNKLSYDRKSFKGLVFVASDVVRYQAPSTPGNYQVTYTVRDAQGDADSATITFAVHEADADTKAAPTPQDAEAQVAAGQKIKVPITLRGIDPDGDDVQLLGLGNSAPRLGRVTEVGADYLIYEAYGDSKGTDEFTYAVEDWTGRRAQGTVRVGVFAGGAASSVYARDDSVTLRPDTEATVPVLLNDVSSDDSELTVSAHLETQGDLKDAKVKDGQVSFTTGAKGGTGYIVYTISNKAGLTDHATLAVSVDPDAAIQPPTAYDYRVPAAATIDKRSVDVDVSPWIANPSGPASELKVGVDPSAADHASVVAGKPTTIRVELTDEARAVPYTVTNTKYGITSTAFIQVPAYGVFAPTVRRDAPKLTVNAGGTLTIDIADQVRVGVGKVATIQAGSVQATKASNTDLEANDHTIKFVADSDYSGPASVTFTATDGKSESAGSVKHVNSASITLPITIVGKDTTPPTFSTTTVDVVAGESATTIDLTALTRTDTASDDERLTYSSVSGGQGITTALTSDGKLTVGAAANAKPGTNVSVTFLIGYGQNKSVKAGITVRVTASTRPWRACRPPPRASRPARASPWTCSPTRTTRSPTRRCTSSTPWPPRAAD